MPQPPKTSWQRVASWYDDLLENDPESYQARVILPNILRLIDPQKGEQILDVACGQGYFSRALASLGAEVTAADISAGLIDFAKKRTPPDMLVHYTVVPAEKLRSKLPAGFKTAKALIVLALQNIKDADKAIAEVAATMTVGGRFWIVLNHPIFRIPKKSSWGFDDAQKKQYRRIDGYMNEFETDIDMHPGKKGAPQTVSFHRPLQWYFKMLRKNGFRVSSLEEWISHKKSQLGGKRSAEEDRIRTEIPLFMCLECVFETKCEKETRKTDKTDK